MKFNNVHELAKNVELKDEVVFVFNNREDEEEQVSGDVSATDDELNHVAINVSSEDDVVYSVEEDSRVFRHDKKDSYKVGDLLRAEIKE